MGGIDVNLSRVFIFKLIVYNIGMLSITFIVNFSRVFIMKLIVYNIGMLSLYIYTELLVQLSKKLQVMGI